MDIKGRIHSFESFGTVDGPGIRFVVFMQGCHFRCLYCHNPDTWDISGGTQYTVDEVTSKITRYLPYFKKSGGGLTVSGGEPLQQIEFVSALFKKCRDLGIHTAIDTNGSIPIPSDFLKTAYGSEVSHEDSTADKVLNFPASIDTVLDNTDLVLLDIKHMDSEKHKNITGFSNRRVLSFARHLAKRKIPAWLRYVVVPGFSDSETDISLLGGFAKELGNIEKIELLPFHKMGEYKWKELGYPYRLYDIPEATQYDIEKLKKILEKYL